MFRWYERAALCFAFLSDYTIGDSESRLSECRWFTRGFTLQELLAPQTVIFFDSNLSTLGTRSSLAHKLAVFTQIAPTFLLDHDTCRTANVAQRMSWASRRQTSRSEDIAYCLLGLFDVNMPLIYGEGASEAFRRLQHEIIARSADESIFAWTSETVGVTRGMFANSPREFASCQHVCRSVFRIRRPAYRTTNRGLDFAIPAVAAPDWISQISPRIFGSPTLVQLECEQREHPKAPKLISIRLERSADGDGSWCRAHSWDSIVHRRPHRPNGLWQTLKTWCYGYVQVYVAEPKSSTPSSPLEDTFGGYFSKRQLFLNLITSLALTAYLGLGFIPLVFFRDVRWGHISYSVTIWLWLNWGWKFSRFSYRYLILAIAAMTGTMFGPWIWGFVFLVIVALLEPVVLDVT